MAGTLTVSTLSSVSTLNAASGVLATQNGMTGIAKAWVNFQGGNGSTAGTVNGSFNVLSVTANSTGDYTVTFNTSMTNANYAVAGIGKATANSGYSSTGNVFLNIYSATSAQTASSVRLQTQYGNLDATNNMNTVCVVCFN